MPPAGFEPTHLELRRLLPYPVGLRGRAEGFYTELDFSYNLVTNPFEEVETMVPFDEELLEYEVEAERVEEAVEGPVAKPVAQPNPRRKRATKKAIRRPNKKTKTGRGMKIRRPAPRRTTRKARKTRKR